MKILIILIFLIGLAGCKTTVENVIPNTPCDTHLQKGYTIENQPYQCLYNNKHQLRWLPQ